MNIKKHEKYYHSTKAGTLWSHNPLYLKSYKIRYLLVVIEIGIWKWRQSKRKLQRILGKMWHNKELRNYRIFPISLIKLEFQKNPPKLVIDAATLTWVMDVPLCLTTWNLLTRLKTLSVSRHRDRSYIIDNTQNMQLLNNW